MEKDGQCIILRFETYGLKTRKPHKVRLSSHLAAQAETIMKLKAVGPRLGKIRIAKILKEMGYKISPSTITRILKHLPRSENLANVKQRMVW